MRYFSLTLWREISFPAAQRRLQAANLDDIILSYYAMSFFIMFLALWVGPFKHAHVLFMCGQLATILGFDLAIHWSMLDASSTRVLFRAVDLIYFAFIHYAASMWVQHCAFDFPIRKPLTEEERRSASWWKRFWSSRFFLNRLTMGSGRWHTYIGTDSWRVALLWRLSVPLFVSLAVVGTGVGFAPRNALLYGVTVAILGLATVQWKKEPTRAEDIVPVIVPAEEQALLEKDKFAQV